MTDPSELAPETLLAEGDRVFSSQQSKINLFVALAKSDLARGMDSTRLFSILAKTIANGSGVQLNDAMSPEKRAIALLSMMLSAAIMQLAKGEEDMPSVA